MAESLILERHESFTSSWYSSYNQIYPVFLNSTPYASSSEQVTPTNISLIHDGGVPEFAVYQPALAVVLAIFCVATVFGNVLVMVAVAREQYLHTVTNYFIASLATADCLVGAVVMPFSAVHEVMDKYWMFGQDWCDTWRSLDVLASTASILNLCVISMDRYWAITDPIAYPSRMTPTKAGVLIALVWICSALISFPAIAWWRAVSVGEPPEYQCLFTEDVGYLVFSSTISFYGPLTVMVFTYCRIYKAAVKQTRSLKLGTKHVHAVANGEPRTSLTLRIHRGGVFQPPSYKSICANAAKNKETERLTPVAYASGAPCAGHVGETQVPMRITSRNMKAFSISRKLSKLAKERKAAKTLGIVMGVFILCWLPFFVTNVLMGICGESCIMKPDLVSSVVTWLGWLNSGMNPVIYACWSRDFRRAFSKLLCSCFPGYLKKREHYRTRFRRTMREDIMLSSLKSTTTTQDEIAYCCGQRYVEEMIQAESHKRQRYISKDKTDKHESDVTKV